MLIEPPLEEYQRSGAVYDKYWSWDEVYQYTVNMLYLVLMIFSKNGFSNMLVYFKFCAFLNFYIYLIHTPGTCIKCITLKAMYLIEWKLICAKKL